MQQAKRMATPLVWRVTESDLDTICPWLLPALQKRWPRLHTDGISYWFKSAVGDRRTLFIRTANVVGMWHSLSDILEPEPVIVEKFVRSNDNATIEEQILLYKYVKEWSQQIRARECILGLDTDVGMTTNVQPALQSFKSPCRKKTIYVLSFEEA